MTITIVCVCGHHNLVFDTELETARCEMCDVLLLRPAPAVTAPQVAPVPRSER